MKKKNVTIEETGEDIVLDLENNAENANEHNLCTIYRTLYEILLETVNEKEAVKIMKAIRDHNGFLPSDG